MPHIVLSPRKTMPKFLSGLRGLGDAEDIELETIDMTSGGSDSSWFSWASDLFSGGEADPCSTGAAVEGSQCWAQGWRPAGNGTNVKIGNSAPTPSPNVPSGWSDTLTNAISAISTGFWPKPTTGAGPQTTPVVAPTMAIATPWYKTMGGKIGIAAAILGGAYYVTRGRAK